MGTRTNLTSSIKVPIAVGWKCSSCGNVNKTLGNLMVTSSVTVGGSGRRVEKAKQEMQEELNASWKNTALGVITDTKDDPQLFRNSVFLADNKCSKCKKKEKWSIKQWFLAWGGLIFMGAIISLICVIAAVDSPIAWIIFLAFAGAVVYGFVEESTYKKRLKSLSSEYMPVIVSLNPELNDFAQRKGIRIPVPADIEQIGVSKTVSQPVVNVTPQSEDVKSEQSQNSNSQMASNNVINELSETDEAVFCYKCGNKLKSGSKFCSFCGTDLN